jgi:hypothetical protein
MLLRTLAEDTPLGRFRKIERTLHEMGGSIDDYKRLDTDRLAEAIGDAREKLREQMRSVPFHSFMADPGYGRSRLKLDALIALREFKMQRDGAEDVVVGMTYYRNVREVPGEAGMLAGERCTYLGESSPKIWVPFFESARKLKIMEMLRHGTDEDFRKMYLDLADGRPIDAPVRFVAEHITGSSDGALSLMEQYADSRWDGPWPWQTTAPKRLRDMIRGEQDMRSQRLAEMRGRFDRLHARLMEGEIETAQAIMAVQDFVEDVDSMIQNLAKASGEILVNMRDQARMALGDDSAKSLEMTAQEHIGVAVDALSTLKAAMSQQLDQLKANVGGGGMPPAAAAPPAPSAMSQDLAGAPMDPAMGGDPAMGADDPSMVGDDTAAVMAPEETGERPKK